MLFKNRKTKQFQIIYLFLVRLDIFIFSYMLALIKQINSVLNSRVEAVT